MNSEIVQDWAVVKKFCSGSHRQALIPGCGFINETPPEEFYNLPLVLAYGVLDQVLSDFMEKGLFPSPNRKRPLLGDKMIASRHHLQWRNYEFVEQGKNARNNLAHEGYLLGKFQCLEFIDAIENELNGWGVL